MTDIRIEHLGDDRLSAAPKLVGRVFPHEGLPERFSFWAIANPRSPLARKLMAWHGITEFLDFWGAFDCESGTLRGTTGLSSYARDAAEAVWLAWSCVAPEVRRQGIGSHLLDFSIAQAKHTGRKYLRLYTSSQSKQAAAQALYESRGLKIVRIKWRAFYTTIYRELSLDQVPNMGTDP